METNICKMPWAEFGRFKSAAYTDRPFTPTWAVLYISGKITELKRIETLKQYLLMYPCIFLEYFFKNNFRKLLMMELKHNVIHFFSPFLVICHSPDFLLLWKPVSVIYCNQQMRILCHHMSLSRALNLMKEKRKKSISSPTHVSFQPQLVFIFPPSEHFYCISAASALIYMPLSTCIYYIFFFIFSLSPPPYSLINANLDKLFIRVLQVFPPITMFLCGLLTHWSLTVHQVIN